MPAAARQLPNDSDREPQTERRDKPMMVSGIILVAVAPLALLGAVMAGMDYSGCRYGLDKRLRDGTLPVATRDEVERCEERETAAWLLGVGGALLIAGGIPMIIIGGKRAPATQSTRAALAPWASRSAVGLRLRLDL